jgi:chromosome segregation ATPase
MFATLTLCLMAIFCAKMRIDQRRALWITAEWMADLYNHDLYSRESAKQAIQRYNEHIERCNRAIEAGDSGHSVLNVANEQTEALRAELQRVGTELAAAKRENEILQEQLRTKSTLITEMSLRLDALRKGSDSDGERANGVPVQGANPDLVKHINGLQEQLYAERQKNRQLKGA